MKLDDPLVDTMMIPLVVSAWAWW